MIIEFHITLLLVGIICGVLEAWNKKVMFGVWLLAIVYTIYNGTKGINLNQSKGISNWFWITLLGCFTSGMWIGNSSYRQIFETKRGVK